MNAERRLIWLAWILTAVGAFAERLRDQVELGQLDEALMDVVTSVVQPNGLSLWLRRDLPRA